ncbi:HAD-like protein [Gyrodon lividus]|nr:HAD-like protein [Gyrodon lividus]
MEGQAFLLVRSGVDDFLKKIYEEVLFTANISKTSITRSHTNSIVSCYQYKGNYIKGLFQLGRPMSSTIIVDNISLSYYFQPNNGVPVTTWTNDPSDRELETVCAFLTACNHTGCQGVMLDRSLIST